MAIGKVEIVPIRQAFPHEAHNFTSWLENNIDALSDRIGIELNVIEREKSVGSFNVDLYCEDDNGDMAIIENQLERTDHDHLGKLLTYMVNLEAKTAIWVATEARPEHQRVIDWLNEYTPKDMAFYFVQVEAIRIEDSPFAPLFTVLSQPDEQIREIGKQKKELAEQDVQLFEFWKHLLERSKGRTRIFDNQSPRYEYSLKIGAGKSGYSFYCVILKDRGASLKLVIDIGDQHKNKELFDRLLADREAIEMEFGHALDWERRDHRKSSRIVKQYRRNGSLNEPDTWNDLADVLINATIKFDKTFRPRIQQIDV
jgi:hypothetical protein